MKKVKFVIQDWAGNFLQYTGKFQFGAYGKLPGVPMEFQSWDDAEDWLSEKLGDAYESDRGEYYIEEKRG